MQRTDREDYCKLLTGDVTARTDKGDYCKDRQGRSLHRQTGDVTAKTDKDR